MKFIECTSEDGTKNLIFIDKISFVVNSNYDKSEAKTFIRFEGGESAFLYVLEPYEDVKKKIEDALSVNYDAKMQREAFGMKGGN